MRRALGALGTDPHPNLKGQAHIHSPTPSPAACSYPPPPRKNYQKTNAGLRESGVLANRLRPLDQAELRGDSAPQAQATPSASPRLPSHRAHPSHFRSPKTLFVAGATSSGGGMESMRRRREGWREPGNNGNPGVRASARGRQPGILPSALGGSTNTLCASSSRPWPWSVTLSTNLPSTTQFRDFSRPWATPRWCRYLIPWRGARRGGLSPAAPCPVLASTPAPHTP